MLLTSAVIATAFMQVGKKPVQTNAPKPKIAVESTSSGEGAPSVAGDIVTVDYIGRLSAGVVFDSSMPVKGDAKHPGTPPLAFTVGVGQAVPGFDQAVLGKKVGAKFRVTIPPTLAYGARGTKDGGVPPNSTLIFDVHVLGILPKSAKQAIVIQSSSPGTGPEVKAKDTVSIQYTGTFLNGFKFDSSRDRNQPFSFRAGVGAVVPGFDQAVMGMKKGGKRKVTIPPELAYGPEGRGPIPPNATLVFDIELVDVKAG